MISQLPRWVEAGAFLLALLAGSINTIGLLGFQHQAVSHLTGTATLAGMAVFELSPALPHLLFILLSFMGGAMASGALIDNTALKLGRSYGIALVLEAALLLIAMVMLINGSAAGHYAASAACGLQNAMATTYSGAVIRTTHVTGLFTDLGLMLGMRLRGKGFDRRRALLYCWIILGFIGGGAVGAIAYGQLGFAALALPASLCLLLALAYALFSRRRV